MLTARAQFRPTVYRNLLDSANSIITAMRKLGVDPAEPANRANAELIANYKLDPDPKFIISEEICTAIDALWRDPVIPQVMDHTSEFYLMDSAP